MLPNDKNLFMILMTLEWFHPNSNAGQGRNGVKITVFLIFSVLQTKNHQTYQGETGQMFEGTAESDSVDDSSRLSTSVLKRKYLSKTFQCWNLDTVDAVHPSTMQKAWVTRSPKQHGPQVFKHCIVHFCLAAKFSYSTFLNLPITC